MMPGECLFFLFIYVSRVNYIYIHIYKKKKRYKLYPNQLYSYIQDKPEELERYFEKTEIETKHGTKTLYMKYKKEEDILR